MIGVDLAIEVTFGDHCRAVQAKMSVSARAYLQRLSVGALRDNVLVLIVWAIANAFIIEALAEYLARLCVSGDALAP